MSKLRNLLLNSAFVLMALQLPLLQCLADDASMRVMSFNIRYGSANDGDDHWKTRDSFVVDVIRDFDPDLLGTQETLGFQAKYLQDQLPQMIYVGSSRDDNPDGEQCGILYCRDRFEQLDAGQFWLSETPQVKFSKSWDSSLPRIATWVRLLDRISKQQLLFVNTHFDHQGQIARQQSAAAIRTFAESQPQSLPVIITGDFNCAEDSEPYATLLGATRLVDSFRIVHPQRQSLEGTFNGFKGTSDGARIDWILCSPEWQVQSAEINRTNRNGKYPSDHYPVSTILKLR